MTGPPRWAVEHAARLARDLADDPSLARAAEQWSQVTGWSYEEAHDRLRRFRDGIRAAAAELGRIGEAMRQAGIVPEEPPDDLRARALRLRQHRNTGPDRDLTRQRPPRTHAR